VTTDKERLEARLRALFLDELADNVIVLNRGLVALEQQDEEVDTDTAVREMFRAAHSLKGAAHSAGVDALVRLCHHLEDALSRLRDGTLPPSTRVIEPILEAVDALSAAGRRMREGDEAAGADVVRAGRRLGELVGAPADSRLATGPAPALVGLGESAARDTPTADPIPAHAAVAGFAPGDDGNVRVPATRLDALLNQAGELLLACRQVDALAEALAETADAVTRQARTATAGPAVGRSLEGPAGEAEALKATAERLDGLARVAVRASRVLTTLGTGLADGVRRVRMMPLTRAYEGLERVVRDLARAGDKDVRLLVHAGEVEVDRPILDAIAEALLHLVRNAVDHGIETPDERAAAGKPRTGRVTVDCTLEKDGVSVRVLDDGRGIDLETLRAAARRRGLATPDDDSKVADVAFSPGVSTSALITDASGRGVGLDAVRARVERVGGTVRLESTAGSGCTVVLMMPLSLSAVRVLLVSAAGETLGLPSAAVSRLLRMAADDLRPLGAHDVVIVDGRPVPLLWLADGLALSGERGPPSAHLAGVLVGSASTEAVLVVDELLSEEEVVMRPFGEGSTVVAGVLGATILSSGRVALVINPTTCVRAGLSRRAPSTAIVPTGLEPAAARKRVLLAEDTLTTRALERSILEAAGYEVVVAVDGVEAWHLLEEHGADVVVTDVDMPRMDGVALCEAARRSDRFRDIPFVLVTALANDADRRRGIEAGANAYLVKADFDQVLLLDTLERLL
jgi:two-component system chemotaxis sensor kinase CheA